MKFFLLLLLFQRKKASRVVSGTKNLYYLQNSTEKKNFRFLICIASRFCCLLPPFWLLYRKLQQFSQILLEAWLDCVLAWSPQ